MLAYLRIRIEQKQFATPYEYAKSGQLRFWHPPNSHDDQLWALVLACYASKQDESRGVLARAW